MKKNSYTYLSRQAWLLSGLLLSGTALAQVDPVVGGAPNAALPGREFSSLYGWSGNGATPTAPKIIEKFNGGSRSVIQLQVNGLETPVTEIGRAEVYPSGEKTRNNADLSEIPRWYAMSVYLPEGFMDTKPATLIQLGSIDGVTPAPRLAVVARGDQLQLSMNYKARKALATDLQWPDAAGYRAMALGTFKTSQWYCFVVKATWSAIPGQGALDVWMNGNLPANKIYSATKTFNSFDIDSYIVPRLGMVYPDGMVAPQHTMYGDFIWLGGANSNVTQMFKLTPCGTPGV